MRRAADSLVHGPSGERVPRIRNVLHVITGLERGGAEGTLVQVLLRSRGSTIRHRVVTLIEGGVYTEPLRSGGIDVTSLGMPRGRMSAGGLLRLTQLMREERPGVVMTWLYHADLLGTLAGGLAHVPALIWNIRCSNMDMSRYGITMRMSVAALSRLSRFPTAIGYNSHAGREAHVTFGYRPRRWLYLPNGVDLDNWYPDALDRSTVREELGIGADDVLIAMVARLDPKKDHAGFLEAFRMVLSSHSVARAVLIGSGTERMDIPMELRDRVLTLGDRSDVNRLLRGCDIAVSSSAFGEGFPNVIAESMASGLTCVVTDVGDARMLVSDCGVVVRPNDPHELAVGINGLVEAGEAARRERGRMARERVARHWSIERAITRYNRVFAALMQ